MKQKTPKASEVSQLVDELGRIDVRLKSVQLDVKRAETIKRQLRALMDESPAEASASFPGSVFVALVSERRFEKSTDNEKLYRYLGKKTFLAIASVTQKEIEARVPENDRAAMTTEARTGSRTVTTVFKQAAIDLAKAA